MEKRRLSNLIIDPKPLARLSIPFLILAALSITIVLTLQYKIMDAVKGTELSGVENIPAMNALLHVEESVTTVATIGIVGFCLVCLGLWILFSHRIFGPMVPMRRHIQRLIAGDFTSRIQPRAGDEFREVIQDLNRLAETLEQRQTTSVRQKP